MTTDDVPAAPPTDAVDNESDGRAPGQAVPNEKKSKPADGPETVSANTADLTRRLVMPGITALLFLLFATVSSAWENKPKWAILLASVPVLIVLVQIFRLSASGWWRKWYIYPLLIAAVLTLVLAPDIEAAPEPEDGGLASVVMMDSTIEPVVYSAETYAEGGTNADDISEVLDDLSQNLVTVKETTNLAWNREDALIAEDHDLIVIHGSAFYGETSIRDPEDKFSSFVDYVANRSDVRFLIYSRFGESEEELREIYATEFPQLAGRFDVIWMGGGRQWDDVDVGRELKEKVSGLLAL